ncbi:hypothetical protein [Hydrogenophaga electricum]|uniref:DUF4376 domain-containing protein n=1 Tax=Hydrogenophaga electricum TaxID=1230953 RepID=A0ABQ6C3N4_9BURK|nr:hypothetical protein [Hydrogenophaga electricum]GLS13604.1 hypothetical protein GCM10007935_10340 [Hydrogenophaga electricum]
MRELFCQLAPEDDVYTGPVWAFDTTITPGVIVPPVRAVRAEQPEVPPGHQARWQGEGLPWLIEALPLPPEPPAPAPLTEAQALQLIDAQADAIVRAVIGDRAEEYRQAEAEATAWHASGHADSAPPSVAVWASVSGMDEVAACADILAQAATWRAALLQIRTARLTAKAAIRAGDDATAWADWAAFVGTISAALGITTPAPAEPLEEPAQ